MADFIVYHSENSMREAYDPSSGLGFVTAKRTVRKCIGDTVWIIQGRGRHTHYTLESCFEIDHVEEINDERFQYHARGNGGVIFNPPIPLSAYPWFRRLFVNGRRYSHGLFEMPVELVREFERFLTWARRRGQISRAG
jgi:hypothetical protein